MKSKKIYYLALLALVFAACNADIEVKKDVFGGYAQKGPFINGSSVTISELDKSLDQTGRVYSTSIISNTGAFEQKNIELISNYVELKADGFYFNEISGQNSTSQMTLYALADIKDVNSANVNVLTHLERPRVEYLVKQEEKSFSDAKKQAQREVLAIFGFEPAENSSEALNLTDNSVLLAVSCILQGYLSTGDMMELMANISSEIKTNGVLKNTDLGTKLINNAYTISISISNVRNNLTKKYAELGSSVTIPDFESYVQSFLESELYPRTVSINYPETGMHGDNILSDKVTSVKKYVENGTPMYSIKADVSKGQSLKIVLKDGTWSDLVAPAPINWNVGKYNSVDKSQEYTVIESGKPCDLPILIQDGTLNADNQFYITVEYYENGSVKPTKIKTLYVEE
jgi:hypothetical protein